MNETMPTADEVLVAVEVAAPLARAFAVFTEEFGAWWPESHHLSESGLDRAFIEPGVGGRWYERGKDGSECVWGSVVEWDPPNSVSLRWQLDARWRPGVPSADASLVEVRFEPLAQDRTRVQLTHRGIRRHGEGWESIRDSVGAANGWAGILEQYRDSFS